MEDAVCDLLGRHWQHLFQAHDTGLVADEWLAGLLDVAGPRAGDGEPAWLAAEPVVSASPEVLLLRDVYGLRFGVVAQLTGPGGQPRP